MSAARSTRGPGGGRHGGRRPGVKRTTPPPADTSEKTSKGGWGCPFTAAAAAGVVLGVPMILAGMWSYRPELGRPLTLATLLVAFLAASLTFSRSAVWLPQRVAAGRDSTAAAVLLEPAADGPGASTIPASPARRPAATSPVAGRCVTPGGAA